MTRDPAAPSELDGRNQRRVRNREAVIDSALLLVCAGNHSPSLEELAAHSGVSYRSVYRYFENLDELVVEAAKRGVELAAPLVDLPDVGVGPLEERIERFVDTRLALHESTVGLSVAARSTYADVPAVAGAFDQLRTINIGLIDRHFVPELCAVESDRRADIVHAIYLAFLFESLRFLLELHADDPARVRRALAHHIHVHLGAH